MTRQIKRGVAWAVILLTTMSSIVTAALTTVGASILISDWGYLSNSEKAAQIKTERMSQVLNMVKSGQSRFLVSGLNEQDLTTALFAAYMDPEFYRYNQKEQIIGCSEYWNNKVRIWDIELLPAWNDEEVSKFEEDIQNDLEKILEPDMTDKEKLWRIYQFVINRLTYTASSEYRNLISVYESGLAVCTGYAGLFTLMARRAGFEADVICGKATVEAERNDKGYSLIAGQEYAHLWSIVNTEEGPIYFDPTWGDGDLTNQMKWFWRQSFDETHARYDFTDYVLGERYGDLTGSTTPFEYALKESQEEALFYGNDTISSTMTTQ